jgi:hypothetical protein
MNKTFLSMKFLMVSFGQSRWHPGKESEIDKTWDEVHCELHLDSGGALILGCLQGNVDICMNTKVRSN